MTATPEITIGLVGVCGSGKSTLKERLEVRGLRVRHIAQEHSYVKDMWKRLANPDVLIFLEASFETTLLRRGASFWNEEDYQTQLERLAHARQHADFVLATDGLTPEQVAGRALEFIQDYTKP